MGSILDKVSKNLNSTNFAFRSNEARQWLRKEASKLGQVNRSSIIRDPSRTASSPYPGSMFFMYYDPKGKEKLPYWDKFPLILPI